MWSTVQISCWLGFHNYKPVDGLYWEYRYRGYKYYLNELLGVDTVKLFKCSKCGKIHKEHVEYYAKSFGFIQGFNLNKVVDVLESRGIQHISEFYVN